MARHRQRTMPAYLIIANDGEITEDRGPFPRKPLGAGWKGMSVTGDKRKGDLDTSDSHHNPPTDWQLEILCGR